uniref:Uncharacterized protein n=1 Tax=Octopus bimaculoides TaxID=37653 RepID=A0A0L8IDK2_OCTBM
MLRVLPAGCIITRHIISQSFYATIPRIRENSCIPTANATFPKPTRKRDGFLYCTE